MKNKILSYFIPFVFMILIALLLGLIVGAVKRNPPLLVGEDTEYLYYKEYTLYNRDSCVYKYHKPIIYNGVVTKREFYRRKRGRHYRRVYDTTIRYNGAEEHNVRGWDYYSKHKEGDKVKVKIVYYPKYSIQVLN